MDVDLDSFDAEKTCTEIAAEAASRGVPIYMTAGIARWVVYGKPPGMFLRAFLSNDLMEAVRRTDATNRGIFNVYFNFLHTTAPSECWGSKENVDAWTKAGGLNGLALAQQKEKEEA